MSRNRLVNASMTPELASNIVANVIRGRKRWGKQYTVAAECGEDQLLDALLCLAETKDQAATEAIGEMRKELASSNRALGAAKARETKVRKQLEQARAEVERLQAKLAEKPKRKSRAASADD